MTTKKKDWRERPRPDRYSEKTEGKLKQTLRLDPEENRLIRMAAELDRLSINTWAIRVLMVAATKQIAVAAKSQPKPTPRKRVKLG